MVAAWRGRRVGGELQPTVPVAGLQFGITTLRHKRCFFFCGRAGRSDLWLSAISLPPVRCSRPPAPGRLVLLFSSDTSLQGFSKGCGAPLRAHCCCCCWSKWRDSAVLRLQTTRILQQGEGQCRASGKAANKCPQTCGICKNGCYASTGAALTFNDWQMPEEENEGQVRQEKECRPYALTHARSVAARAAAYPNIHPCRADMLLRQVPGRRLVRSGSQWVLHKIRPGSV